MNDPDLRPLPIRLQRISDELQRIEESARDSGSGQFEQAGQWRGVNLILGIPATALAAIAGAGGTSETIGPVLAGLLALAAAGFGAILTVVNAGQRNQQATTSANAYREIQTAARQARLIDLPWMDESQARDVLRELTNRRDEVNNGAEPANWLAWRRARRGNRRGHQTYTVDARGDEE